MKRKQFTEEQIIGILKEAEAGAVVTELCRRQAQEGTQARRGHAGTGTGIGSSQPALEPRLRPRPARHRAAVPRAQHRR